MNQGCSETDHTSNRYFSFVYHLPVQHTLSAISPFLHTFESQSLPSQGCDMFLNIFGLSVIQMILTLPRSFNYVFNLVTRIFLLASVNLDTNKYKF